MSENWIHEATPGHEGRLISLVVAEPGRDRFGDAYRELRPTDAAYDGFYPQVVQVGCTCGWRSSRMDAPIDLLWRPEGWTSSRWFADVCFREWLFHAKATVYSAQERARVTGFSRGGE